MFRFSNSYNDGLCLVKGVSHLRGSYKLAVSDRIVLFVEELVPRKLILNENESSLLFHWIPRVLITFVWSKSNVWEDSLCSAGI